MSRGFKIAVMLDGRQSLTTPEGFSLRRLHRDGAAAGSKSLLTDALATLDWPAGESGLYLWAAREHAAFREIRAAAGRYLRPKIDAHLGQRLARRRLGGAARGGEAQGRVGGLLRPAPPS